MSAVLNLVKEKAHETISPPPSSSLSLPVIIQLCNFYYLPLKAGMLSCPVLILKCEAVDGGQRPLPMAVTLRVTR